MPRKAPVTETLSLRFARLRQSTEKHRAIRLLGSRGAAALLLGTALSIGGIAETMSNMQFLVQKDLDAVRVVRVKGDDATVVADLKSNFTNNTVFKLAQVLPDRYVSRELALFDQKWIATDQWAKHEKSKSAVPHAKRGVLGEITLISDAIRAEFFSEEVPYGALIYEKAKKYDVDPALVAAVIEQESKFRPRAKSPVGARGLMQLMPRTGRWMGARNLYDPEQNIDAGVKYIKYLNERFDGDLKKTIAAYNGGEGNVMRYRGVPPFRETRQYVKKVMKNYDKHTKRLEKYHKDQVGGSVPEADGTLTVR